MDPNPTTPPTDEPVPQVDEPTTVPPVDTTVVDQPEVPAEGTEQVVTTPPEPTAAPAEPVTDDDDEFDPSQYNLAPVAPIDFNNLTAGENGEIDANALIGQINASVQQAENRATQRAQLMFEQQRFEEKLWDKAYEKYPDLKTDKELKGLVHQARIGEATEQLSRIQQDPGYKMKVPTPSQIADKLFKHISTAKTAGMKQATENTVIQQSARLESGSNRGTENVEQTAAQYKNINNPNKEIAVKARSAILADLVFPSST